MENKDETKQAPKLNWLRQRPGLVGGVLVVLLWLIIGLPGMGQFGLWDPWEMNRANVARHMTDAPRVLVLEDTLEGESLGPIGSWLALRYGKHLQVSSLDLGHARHARSARKLLDAAAKTLDAQVHHLLVVNLADLVKDPENRAQVETLTTWFHGVKSKSPGLTSLLAAPLPKADNKAPLSLQDYEGNLKSTWTEVRLQLSAKELDGGSWGKPGHFRKAMIRTLKAAGEHSPLKLYEPNKDNRSFLEQGFWRAAQKRQLTGSFERRINRETATLLSDSPLFELQEAIVWWPQEADYNAVVSDFRSGEESARQEARDAVASLETVVDTQTPSPRFRAQFKRKGRTRSVAPLDYWLTAKAFEHLGFSEFTARLPAFLLGLLTILLLYTICLRLFGVGVATFSAIVLITCPLFFAQGRSAAGELSASLALTAGVGGLLLSTHRQALTWLSALLILIAAAMAFFSQGLVGLLTLTLVAVVYNLVSRPRNFSLWLPSLVLALLLGSAWLAVSDSGNAGYLSQFSLKRALFDWSISDSERPGVLNFDLLIRQIGFGLVPWIALAPFALGHLFTKANSTHRKYSFLVLLWFVVPYFVHSFLVKDANHLIYPAAPAFAVATGILLAYLAQGRSLGLIAGVTGAIILMLLIANLNKSPEPLTAFLTMDPPTHGTKGNIDYPEALKVPTLLKMTLLAAVALLLIGPARLASRLRRILGFMARPIAFWTATSVAVLLLIIFLLMGLESQIAQGLSTRTGMLLEPVHRVFVRSVFYWRPETWALGLLTAGGALSLVIHHTRWLPWLKAWSSRWLITPLWGYLLGLIAICGALGSSLQESLEPASKLSTLTLTGAALVFIGPLIALRLLRSRLAGWSTRWSPLSGLTQSFAVFKVGTVSLAWALWLVSTQVGAEETVVSALLWLGLVLSTLPMAAALSRATGRNTQIATIMILVATVGDSILFGHSSALAISATIALMLLFAGAKAHRIPINGALWLLTRLPGATHLARDRPAFVLTHLCLGFGALVAALILTLAWGEFAPDAIAFASWQSPITYVGAIALCLSWLLSYYLRRSGSAALSTTMFRWGVPLAFVAWILAGWTVQLLYESGLNLADFMSARDRGQGAVQLARTRGLVVGALIVVASMAGLNLLWGRIQSSPRRAFALFFLGGLVLTSIMVAALSRKWIQLQPAVQSPDTEPFLSYLFFGSRRALLLYGVLAMLAVLAAGAWLSAKKPDWSRLWGTVRILERFERPRVFVTTLMVVMAVFAFLYNQQLVKALSFHVSQKHLLETVQNAEPDDDAIARLYQHGVGGQSSNNFYTRLVPEVKDTKTALAALAARSDTVLNLSLSGQSLPTLRVVQAFSATNDLDGDGRRDWAADTGIIKTVSPAEEWIEDPSKSWIPGQWKGFLLIDSDGWRFPITSNTAARVYYNKHKASPPQDKKGHPTPRNAPAFDHRPSARNRYRLDSKDAKDHTATAMSSKRVYFLLSKVGQHAPAYSDRGSFSDLNFQYRKAGNGEHLKVMDDRSSRILLATSRLQEGEEDRNWLARATLTDAAFSERVKAGKIRGVDTKSPLGGMIDWEGKIRLLGWSMDDRTVSRGKKLRIYLYFKAIKASRSSYKIFLHMDRAGHRIHGDHWPLAVSKGKDGKHCIGCYQSDHWLPGDIVVDSFERDVPLGAPSGETDLNMGLYNPQNDKRMKIERWDEKRVRYSGNDNRARIGSFIVR